jgi:rare lipoprotein A
MTTTSRWTHAVALLALSAAVLLAGCASGPRGPSAQRDGAESSPPTDLARVPDAEPKLETIRSGGPNKPYEVLGQNYVPLTQDKPFTERGLASWYGRKFHGRRTASGEVYNMYAMTAAHPTLPIPSYARIRNPANGREVVVRINDRGPFHPGRIVDLSYTAALKLDLLRGVAPVELMRITFDDIRTGAWRRDTSDAPTRLAAASDAARDAGDGGGGNGGNGGNGAPARGVAAPSNVAVPAASVVMVASVPAPEASAASSAAVDTPPAAASSPNAAPAPVADAPAARAYTTPARGFWVQLGAFRERGGAESFQGRVASELDWLSPLLAVFSDASMYRLQAGPYPSRDEARAVAERVRSALQLVPVIVERR